LKFDFLLSYGVKIVQRQYAFILASFITSVSNGFISRKHSKISFFYRLEYTYSAFWLATRYHWYERKPLF